jgi:hypothetical protein
MREVAASNTFGAAELGEMATALATFEVCARSRQPVASVEEGLGGPGSVEADGEFKHRHDLQIVA